MPRMSPRVVILTALPVEFRAVRQHLTDLREVVHLQGTVYEMGRFSVTNGWLEVAICETGTGNVEAARETERAIQHFRPDMVFFVGVAGGMKDVALHDVVVATKVYQYSSGKAKTVFLPRPDVYRPAYRLVQRAKAEAKKETWLQRIRSTRPTSAETPHVLMGPVAAGESVLASTRAATYKFIKKEYSDALAVEMEGHGFLGAAYANQGVDALLIRGISDLVKGKKAADDVIHQRLPLRLQVHSPLRCSKRFMLAR